MRLNSEENIRQYNYIFFLTKYQHKTDKTKSSYPLQKWLDWRVSKIFQCNKNSPTASLETKFGCFFNLFPGHINMETNKP